MQDSLICTSTSGGQDSQADASRRTRGSRERPCTVSGTATPAASSSVGSRSTRPTGSGTTWRRLKGPPQITSGTRSEASWQLRLYSALRVRKWQPWSAV